MFPFDDVFMILCVRSTFSGRHRPLGVFLASQLSFLAIIVSELTTFFLHHSPLIEKHFEMMVCKFHRVECGFSGVKLYLKTCWYINTYAFQCHYDGATMSLMASQITSLTVVYSTVYSDADQRKHQSSVSLAFVWGIHRDRWIPRTKGQLRGICFHLMTSSCIFHLWFLTSQLHCIGFHI